MNMTVKQFVEAVHKAWAEDPFLSGTPIVSVKCYRCHGFEYFYVELADKTSSTIFMMEDGRIAFI